MPSASKCSGTTSIGITNIEPARERTIAEWGQTLGEVRLSYVLSNDSSVLLGDPTLRLREPTDGPLVEVEDEVVVFATDSVSDVSSGYTGEQTVTLTNDGDEAVEVMYRIMSLTSIDGRRPWGNEFQSHFRVKNFQDIFPALLAAGERWKCRLISTTTVSRASEPIGPR